MPTRKPQARLKSDESRRMTKWLGEYESEAQVFMLDFDVPFTNNLAERDVLYAQGQDEVVGVFQKQARRKCICQNTRFHLDYEKERQKCT